MNLNLNLIFWKTCSILLNKNYLLYIFIVIFSQSSSNLFLIVVLPCILISSKLFCQQMHSLLEHKMLQFTVKMSLYIAPTCFRLFGPSSGSMRRNLAKVTVFVEIISKITSLKFLVCSGNMCCVYRVLCAAQHPTHTLQTEAHIATAQLQF
jgi:hypothetical protein